MSNRNKKVFVLGYFGYNTNQLDGQTIRTRNVYQLLAKNTSKDSLRFFDTESLQNSKINVFRILINLLWCNQLIYMPGKNNLNKLLFLLELILKVKKISIVQVAIGGWLHEYIGENKNKITIFKSFDAILLQSSSLANSLTKDFALTNTIYFPNYRIQNFTPVFLEKRETEVFKIVFMARVDVEKGIDKIFDFAHFVENQNSLARKLLIDFYGPIANKDRDYFESKINQYDFVHYNGVLQPDDIYDTLSNYDVLVLPTRYEGEGFPGTILDAYISGIPVIVSNWKYIPEFVEHGVSGFVYNTENEFYEYILHLSNNLQKLSEMKENAYNKSKEFSEEEAWSVLKDYII